MKLLNTITAMMQQSRERIIETMKERGTYEVRLIDTQEKFAKDNGYNDPDDCEDDYISYRDNEAPYVVFFNKWGTGIDYAVLSARLIDGDNPRFDLKCYNGEMGDDSFFDDDLTAFSMIGVYDVLMERLGMKDEPEKVYILTNHAATECEYLGTNNRVFKRKEDAIKAFEEWKKDEMKYVNRYEWKIGTDTSEHFEAYEDGDYCANHTEGFINEYEIE